MKQTNFFTVIQKQNTTKTINCNFFSCPEKLERYVLQTGVTALVALIINIYLIGSISLNKKHDDVFSLLHLPENDANCFKSTNYVLKLVKDFLDKPLEKNNGYGVVRLPPHEDFICGIFLTPRLL